MNIVFIHFVRRFYLVQVVFIFLILVLSLAVCADVLRPKVARIGEIDLLSTRIDELYEQGKYEEAMAAAEEAVTFAEKELGIDHTVTLKIATTLANMYKAQHKSWKSEALYIRVLNGLEHRLGTDSLETLSAVMVLAAFYQEQSRFGDAETLYKQAAETAKRAFGAGAVPTVQIERSLAEFYDQQGRYSDSEPILQRILAIFEQSAKDERHSALASATHLALHYMGRGKYDKAEPLLERSLEGYRRLLGDEDVFTLVAMNNLGGLYYNTGRYIDAEPLFVEVLKKRKKVLGEENPDTLISASLLANLYDRLGEYAKAEALNKYVLEVKERNFGPDDPQTLNAVRALALSYTEQGYLNKAEPLFETVLMNHQRLFGNDGIATLASTHEMAAIYYAQGRLSEAEALGRQALEATIRVQGSFHPAALWSMTALAVTLSAQGRYDEAEQLFNAALEVRERSLGDSHPDTLDSVNKLGLLYERKGYFEKAENAFRRVLRERERTLGFSHSDTLQSVNNIGILYYSQRRYLEAAQLIRRAFNGFETTKGKDHPDTLTAANNLAAALTQQDGAEISLGSAQEEAEGLLRRAMESREHVLGKNHPETIGSVGAMGEFYRIQKRYSEAEPLCKRSLSDYERVLGERHPLTLIAVNNLALVYSDLGRLTEAEALHKRALSGQEQALGTQHPETLASLNNLAVLYFARSEWENASTLWRRNVEALGRQFIRDTQNIGEAITVGRSIAIEQNNWQFPSLVKTLYRLQEKDGRTLRDNAAEAFEVAQWTMVSKAARNLALMAARGGSAGKPELAALIRERQDLNAQWLQRESVQNTALGLETAKRNAKAEAENGDSMASIDARIVVIDKRLAAEFPQYADLASPAPRSLGEVQAQLGEDEALILLLDTPEWQPTPEETFIWVVTKRDLRWFRSSLGTRALSERISALRCGLDGSNWSGSARIRRCVELLGGATKFGQLPFNNKALSIAHELYKELLAPAADLIAGKELLVVPAGPLTALPFQVLVTEAPDLSLTDMRDAHRKATWLAKRHAVTVLPSVAGLIALRRKERIDPAPQAFFGFGDPILTGPCLKSQMQQGCPAQLVQLLEDTRGEPVAATRELWRGLAKPEVIRAMKRLCNTATELRCVAQSQGGSDQNLALGQQATEATVKTMNKEGSLSHYRILHFATHGLFAGELEKAGDQGQSGELHKAGLVFTPPGTATEEDDGLLTASEITELKLNAEWVILSACNTAAGNEPGTEALSGLARAFFYSGARALLVSHWSVVSSAAVEVTTGTFARLRGTTLGKAEALGQAMVALIAIEPPSGVALLGGFGAGVELTAGTFARLHGGPISKAEALRQAMVALIENDRPSAVALVAEGIDKAHPAYWAPFILVGDGR